MVISFGGSHELERCAQKMSEMLKQYAAGREIEIQMIQ
jgi:hypothetical protein